LPHNSPTTRRDLLAIVAPSDRGTSSILARAAVGTGWIVGWRMVTRLLGLASTLILVRLLAPADFGLVALGTSFIVAVDTLSAIGVEDALVREHSPTAAMYHTAFTLTALRGVATTIVIAVAAIPIGSFFAEPRLAYILWALAAGTLIGGIGSIGIVDFRREMAFEKEFALQILPRFVSIVVTIGVALIWHSYWALVAGILTGRIVRTLFGYRMHAWRPRFTLSAWRDLVGFSLWSWAISMTELVRDRIDMFVVGRVISSTAVGIYAIGEEIAFLPGTEIVLPLCRACFPAFAAVHRGGEGMEESFMRPVAATFLLTFPAGVGISLVADPLVRLLMGQNWAGAILIIQLLGVGSAILVFGLVAATLLSAHAMMRPQFMITLVSLGVRFLLLLVLVNQFGIVGAAVGAFGGLLTEHALFIAFAFRRFGLSLGRLVRLTWRTTVAGSLMALILIAAGLGWTQTSEDMPHLVRTLAEAVALGATVYALTLFALWVMSGRPSGAEADMLAMLIRLRQRFTVRRPARRRLS
jgi:lipopolysaccharide exporter